MSAMKPTKNLIATAALTFGVVLSAVALGTAPANAASLTIANPSFESPDLQGSLYNFSIDSWSIDVPPLAGVYEPGQEPTYPYNDPSYGAVPNGKQVAYVNGNGSISQWLTATLLNDTNYLLSVYVGSSSDAYFSSGYNVEFLAGSSVLASTSNVALIPGGFVNVPVSYFSGSNNPSVGQPLGIRLSNGSNSNQTGFDNVTLTATTAIPTPAMLPGLIGVGVAAWRKRKLASSTNA